MQRVKWIYETDKQVKHIFVADEISLSDGLLHLAFARKMTGQWLKPMKELSNNGGAQPSHDACGGLENPYSSVAQKKSHTHTAFL